MAHMGKARIRPSVFEQGLVRLFHVWESFRWQWRHKVLPLEQGLVNPCGLLKSKTSGSLLSYGIRTSFDHTLPKL
jgi:hypothetical protein